MTQEPVTQEPVTTPPNLELRHFNLGIISLGEALADLGTVLQQGVREDNKAKRGGVALGLERAAQSFRNESYSAPDPAELRLRKHSKELLAAVEELLLTNPGGLSGLRAVVEQITERKPEK